MTIPEQKTYFTYIAKKLKAISHTEANPRFSTFKIEEVLSGLATILDVTNFFMLEEDPEGVISQKADENINKIQSAAIMNLKSCPIDDFKTEREIKQRSYELCMEVAAKKKADKRKGINDPQFSWLQYLNENGFAYQPVNTVLDNCYGYRLEFRFTESGQLIVDPEEWND